MWKKATWYYNKNKIEKKNFFHKISITGSWKICGMAPEALQSRYLFLSKTSTKRVVGIREKI